MRRSIWRKLLVVALALLFVASGYLTADYFAPLIGESEFEIKQSFQVTSAPKSDGTYLCEITGSVMNVSESAKKAVFLAVTVRGEDDFSDSEQIPFDKGVIAAGEEIPISWRFSASEPYDRVVYVGVSYPNVFGAETYTIYGTSQGRGHKVLLLSMLGITGLLLLSLVFASVALYRSPKKRVHHKHHKHHHSSSGSEHHHHHSESEKA